MPETSYIRCPHCGQKYNVTPEKRAKYAGKTIPCKKCGQTFVVSPFEPDAATADAKTGDAGLADASLGDASGGDARSADTVVKSYPAAVPTPPLSPPPSPLLRKHPSDGPRKPAMGSRRPPGSVVDEEIPEYKPQPLWQQEAAQGGSAEDAAETVGFKKPLFDDAEHPPETTAPTAAAPGSAAPPGTGAAPPTSRAQQPANRMAQLSVVLGALFFFPLFSLAAVVLGWIGFKEARRRGAGNRSVLVAQIGLSLGLLGLLASPFTLYWLHTKYHAHRMQVLDLACQQNLKQISQGLSAYAKKHDGHFPASFTDALMDKSLDPKYLCCPGTSATPMQVTDRAAVDRLIFDLHHCSYAYIGQGLTLTTAARQPVVMEFENRHGPAAAVRGDESVYHVTAGQMRAMLAPQDPPPPETVVTPPPSVPANAEN